MKKVLGVKVQDGKAFVIEGEAFKCVCIKRKSFEHPISVGSTTHPRLRYVNLTQPPEMNYEKGEIYDCVIDQNDSNTISNYYSVFINELDRNNFTKEEFDKHFMSQEEYRDMKIDKVLSI